MVGERPAIVSCIALVSLTRPQSGSLSDKARRLSLFSFTRPALLAQDCFLIRSATEARISPCILDQLECTAAGRRCGVYRRRVGHAVPVWLGGWIGRGPEVVSLRVVPLSRGPTRRAIHQGEGGGAPCACRACCPPSAGSTGPGSGPADRPPAAAASSVGRQLGPQCVAADAVDGPRVSADRREGLRLPVTGRSGRDPAPGRVTVT